MFLLKKVMYLPFFFAYYGKCDSADFLCNYQYSYLRSRCMTFLLTFSFFFFLKCKSSKNLNVFFCFVFFCFLSGHRQTGINRPDTAPPFPIMQSVVHAVSDFFFFFFSPNELVFYFVLIPLNRLLVYEGSLYQLKNV